MEHLRQSIDAAITEGREQQAAFGLAAAETHFSNLLREIRIGEVSALNERGLVFRMQNNYTAAQRDFLEALKLSRKIEDQDGELGALGGLIDVARTGERDKNYKTGTNLALSAQWAEGAKRVLSTLPEEPPRISRVNARIQIGLLENDTEQYLQALKTYNLAEQELRQLLMIDPNNTYFQNRDMRIKTIRGVTQEALGQSDDAFAAQKEAWDHYTKLGDVRGQENAAVSLAQILKKDNNKVDEARKWLRIALEIALRVGDRDVIDLATKELEELNSK